MAKLGKLSKGNDIIYPLTIADGVVFPDSQELLPAVIGSKADKIPEVNHSTSDTTFTLTPNVMHIWGKVTSLTLSLPTDSDAYLDEYLVTFTAGADFQMYLPNTVEWVQELETEENKVYQVSIQGNLAGWLTNGMPIGSGGSGGSGEVNVIESISVNGTPQSVTSKNVNLLFKTINNESISGTGNITIQGGGGTEDFIYDLDVSSLTQPSILPIQSTAPYEAIDAAYKAGKNVYVRLVSNSYATYGLNGVLLSLVGIQTYSESNVYTLGMTVYVDASSLGSTNMLQGLLLSLDSYGSMFVWSEQDMSDIGGGEDNVIETVKVNGTALTPDANKAVDVTVPTESTVSGWGFTKNTGTYSKPSGGIPSTDLDSAVQTSLGKADSALQSFTESDPTVPSWAKQSTKPSYTASEVGALPDNTPIPDSLSDLSDDSTHRLVTDTEKSTWNSKGTYSKPSGGIPKTDLESSVQTSLGKADSALQSFTESDPTVPSWAKASSKPSYTASEVGAVPTTRTVNGKALSSDISLTASDVGAVSSTDVVTIYSGSSAPSSSMGSNGDIYIKTA